MKFLLILSFLLFPILAHSETEIVLTKDNMVNFSGEVDEFTVAKAQNEAILLCTKNKGSDIYIVLTTPGGSVGAGNIFIDTVKALPCKFHTVTIFAASMGYQIAQNLGTRYILPSGTLMSHRMTISEIGGQVPGELETRLAFYKRTGAILDETAAKRVGITYDEYTKLIYNELWLTGVDAVATHHADEIAKVSCAKNLMTTKEEIVTVLFFQAKVTLSNCPLIIAPLDVKLMTPEKPSEEQIKAVNKHYTDLASKIKK